VGYYLRIEKKRLQHGKLSTSQLIRRWQGNLIEGLQRKSYKRKNDRIVETEVVKRRGEVFIIMFYTLDLFVDCIADEEYLEGYDVELQEHYQIVDFHEEIRWFEDVE
jgi:hypothetical protein